MVKGGAKSRIIKTQIIQKFNLDSEIYRKKKLRKLDLTLRGDGKVVKET